MPDNGELLARIEERTRCLPDVKKQVEETHTKVVGIETVLAERCPARKREINNLGSRMNIVSNRLWYLVGGVFLAVVGIILRLVLVHP